MKYHTTTLTSYQNLFIKIVCFVLVGGWMFFGLSYNSYASSVLLDNLPIVKRSEWGADESWRNAKASSDTSDTTTYNPMSDYKKKRSIAESTIVKWFKKEFTIDTIWTKNNKGGGRLKRPISIKKTKQKLIIHHTAGSIHAINTMSGEIETMKDIYHFHTFTRDRGDIGYNYIIGPLGTIYEGRAGGPDAVGAHASWNNTDSIGIALMGNFDSEQPTKEQIQSLFHLLVALSAKYKINPMKDVIFHEFDTTIKSPYIRNSTYDSMIGHRDVGDTSCPGEHLYKLIPKIKRAVAKARGYVSAKSTQPVIEEIDNDTLYEREDEPKTLNTSNESLPISNKTPTIRRVKQKIINDIFE
ncbi:MAG TPA: peptidoglycan recognition family protein [Candidatus Absconditabacterales bacterium]|nr:peptidoglycan recognition family protein [Candidatus Absconditabacterales bacterium]